MTQTMKPPAASLAPAQVQQPRYIMTDADHKRQSEIEAAWKAYHGQLDKPLQKMPGQPDDNVMSNRCQPVVDRGVDFLFGKPVEIKLGEGAPEEAQKFVDDTWGKTEWRIPLLQKLAMSGAVGKNAFLRIVPSVNKTFRLIVVDPATVCVQTSPQDCETVLLYCIEYSTQEYVNGKPVEVYYREEIRRIDPDQDGDDGLFNADIDASWEIQHWSREGNTGKWTPAGQAITWPYHFPPLFSCQNLPQPHEFWGIEDIPPDYIGMNNALNLVESNINRIGKLYGQPILYATGVSESVIDIKPGRIIGLPTDQSKIASVSFASDVANMLSFANDLRASMDEQSAVPAPALGRSGELPRGQLSGITLELLFMPLLQKTEKKRCLYGKLIMDVTKALLILAGFSPDIEVTLTWQQILPNDDLLSVQAAIAKRSVGVSEETVLNELGYDAQVEMERSKAEAQQAMIDASRGQGVLPAPIPPVPNAQQAEQGMVPMEPSAVRPGVMP